jgi:xanthosine utilization system XapX-like protein
MNTELTGDDMTATPRSFPASRQDEALRLVHPAKKSSVRLPVAGQVPVPPPDQLALYGALGILAAAIAINWPAALVIGAGTAVVVQRVNARPTTEPGESTPHLTQTQAAPALAA